MVKTAKRPAAVSATPNAKVARKNHSTDVSQSKTVSVKSKSAVTTQESLVDSIRSLEAQVYESKKNFNNISTILTYCSHEKYSTQEVLVASQALRRIFLSLLKTKECVLHQSHTTSSKTSEALSKVESWLRTQAWKFIQQLLKSIAQSETNGVSDALVVSFMDVLFDLAVEDARTEFSRLLNIDNSSILIQLLAAMFHSNPSQLILSHFRINWFANYDDLRYAIFKSLAKLCAASNVTTKYKGLYIVDEIASDLKIAHFCENVMDILLECKWGVLSRENAVSTPTANDIARQKRAMSDLWLSLLKTKLSSEGYKRVLMAMEPSILPNITTPLALCDFLTDSFNVGGVVSVLALSGLFVLMAKHNLDYPNFFPKLYSLCDAAVLTARYRARFFKLLSLVLNGSYLPAYLVAAFAKKLIRLSIHAPPASAAYILALIFNLVRKHPIISSIVNRRAAVSLGVVKNVPMSVDMINEIYRPVTGKKAVDEVAPVEETEETAEATKDDEDAEEDSEATPAVSLFGMFKSTNASTTPLSSSLLTSKTAQSSVSNPLLIAERPVSLAQDSDAWTDGKDPFVQSAADPSQACALETSLLEINALCEHYCPDVARIAKLFFADNAPRLGHDIDHFVNLSYDELIEFAMDYRKHRAVPTNYERPQTLLGHSAKIVSSDELFDETSSQQKDSNAKRCIIESCFEF